jgi:hypothetical protein
MCQYNSPKPIDEKQNYEGFVTAGIKSFIEKTVT